MRSLLTGLILSGLALPTLSFATSFSAVQVAAAITRDCIGTLSGEIPEGFTLATNRQTGQRFLIQIQERDGKPRKILVYGVDRGEAYLADLNSIFWFSAHGQGDTYDLSDGRVLLVDSLDHITNILAKSGREQVEAVLNDLPPISTLRMLIEDNRELIISDLERGRLRPQDLVEGNIVIARSRKTGHTVDVLALQGHGSNSLISFHEAHGKIKFTKSPFQSYESEGTIYDLSDGRVALLDINDRNVTFLQKSGRAIAREIAVQLPKGSSLRRLLIDNVDYFADLIEEYPNRVSTLLKQENIVKAVSRETGHIFSVLVLKGIGKESLVTFEESGEKLSVVESIYWQTDNEGLRFDLSSGQIVDINREDHAIQIHPIL